MRKRLLLIMAVAASVLALAMFSAGCGDDDDEDGAAAPTATSEEAEPTEPADGETPPEGASVNVQLTEWTVTPDVASVSAGPVTFTASNIGGEMHELVIIKTDLSPDALPTADDGSVDEAGADIEVIDEIEEFEAGGEESLTVDLEAGNYALICNVVHTDEAGETHVHYANGMTVAFEVTE